MNKHKDICVLSQHETIMSDRRPTSTIVSFDIGTVNMAYCIAQIDNNHNDKPLTIKDWCLTNLTESDEDVKENIEIICSKCVTWLKTVFITNKIRDSKNTYVFIERQRPENPNCFVLSYTIFTYFLSRYTNVNITFVSAKTKPINETGKKRKRAGVKVAKDLLGDLDSNNENDKWSEWFYEQSKKDDLADSFLQIIGNRSRIKIHPEVIPTIVIELSDSDDDN